VIVCGFFVACDFVGDGVFNVGAGLLAKALAQAMMF
jgi:hypothetical protein